MKLTVIVLLAPVIAACAVAQTPKPVQTPQVQADPLRPLQFMVGDWTGADGKGEVGSAGSFSIRPDLGGRILLRRDKVRYTAPGAEAQSLEILVAIAPREDPTTFQANYFDSDGHVLNFTSRRVVADSIAEFISEPVADPMIFRLVYRRVSPDTLNVSFERADAKTPEAFSVVVAGNAARVRRQR